ncbi:hypothetical protein FUAX_12470 [Fulvitalea axinellae]|uniref:MxaA protein n=1 Tax=Fulvitalea axinellae TaxID=1182444 RepID=A0AAU9DD68_9BACT|nr:hypothetical protein FUAX_12470 [Fulvitalea axinellae]
MINRFFVTLLLALTFSASWAQEGDGGKSGKITPVGWFLSDSIKVGEPVEFALSVHYPENINLIFPDSAYNFSPFRFVSKRFFPTETEAGVSVDSAVYTLTTFELSDTLTLKAPVFYVSGDSRMPVYAEPVSIFLQKVTTAQDKLKPVSLGYVRLEEKFDFAHFGALAGYIVLTFIVVVLLFGRRIRWKYSVWQLQKEHVKFLGEMDVAFAGGIKNVAQSERILALWKKYSEELIRFPFTKLTSKEIGNMYEGYPLADHLRRFDRYMYGGEGGDSLTESVEYLKTFAEKVLEDRLTELEVEAGAKKTEPAPKPDWMV